MLSPKLIFQRSKNFTSDAEIWIPPTVPINHYSGVQTNKIDHQSHILLFHANVFKWANACFKHSNFFTVNDANPPTHQLNGRKADSQKMPRTSISTHSQRKRTERPRQKSNYELFNCNNFNIRYWSWNYRGCWHQTCPPIDPRVTKVLKCTHSNYRASDVSPVLLFFVTTSPCRDWVIYAPAAFLRCGSHFSGSLSGIEP